jgi:hypothetical protein
MRRPSITRRDRTGRPTLARDVAGQKMAERGRDVAGQGVAAQGVAGQGVAERGPTGRSTAGRGADGSAVTGRGAGGAGQNVARTEATARGVALIAARACLGTAMIILPALSLPGRYQALTVAGLLLVAASLARPLARWPWIGTLAAVAAAAVSALGHPGTALLAGEGLLILGYLLLADAPAAMPGRVAARWLRLQAPAAAWAVLASVAVLAGLSVGVRTSVWLVVAGAGAAVAATLIALPRRSRQPREPR